MFVSHQCQGLHRALNYLMIWIREGVGRDPLDLRCWNPLRNATQYILVRTISMPRRQRHSQFLLGHVRLNSEQIANEVRLNLPGQFSSRNDTTALDIPPVAYLWINPAVVSRFPVFDCRCSRSRPSISGNSLSGKFASTRLGRRGLSFCISARIT